MKFVEAVNRIESEYGKQAFDHLEDYAENGYTYMEMAVTTGLSATTIGRKSERYGLRELYYKMHPKVRRSDVKVSCVNRSTGEQREYKTMSAAERAFGLRSFALSQNTKSGKAFVHGDWEFRRAN